MIRVDDDDDDGEGHRITLCFPFGLKKLSRGAVSCARGRAEVAVLMYVRRTLFQNAV